jgi:hypothetical protein
VKAVTTQCLVQDKEPGSIWCARARGRVSSAAPDPARTGCTADAPSVGLERQGVMAARPAGPRWAGVSCSRGGENRRE